MKDLTTVFSINPETGKPYMTVEHATNLAHKHINLTSQNLLNHHRYPMEELVQEVLLKMAKSEYKPKLSSPETFFIRCATSRLGNIVKCDFKSHDRHKEGGDFSMFDQDGEPVMATEYLGVESVTPEDIYMANETACNFYSTESKSRPTGWGGFRDGSTKKVKKKNKK